MNSLLFYLFLVTCSFGYGQNLLDKVTQEQTEVQQKLREKYQLTFSELIDYPKTIGLAERMDSLDFDLLFIVQVAGGKDSNRFYIIERYYFKEDSSYFFYYEDGILLSGDYHIYVYKEELEDLDRLYKKKPLIGPVEYPKKKTYRHGCIRPTNARINQFKKRYEQSIKMSHKIFTRIEKDSKSIEVKFEYPPKKVQIKWTVEGGKF